MKKTAKKLQESTEQFYNRYKEIKDSTAEIKLSPDKWTLKEIVGHLIDSASNNHQRFIRFQINDSLEFPDYDKDQWLSAFNYNTMKLSELITLHKSFNDLIAMLIKAADKKSLKKRWNINGGETASITFKELMLHYLEHCTTHFIHFADRLNEIEKSQ